MATLDVEDENIIATIFKESFPDNWHDNPDFAQYLAELSSFGLDKLNREPDRLAEERAQILEQTQELAFDNYKTFIQTAECSREIYEDFQIIEKHVGDMLHKLPDFAETCSGFMKTAQEISTNRKTNTLTLHRHTQLLEVLEIPQLMDTCVRNGYYDEALELSAHVKRVEKKHSGIPVVQGIVTEVKRSCQLMLNQLIQQLRTNLQLPACLRVIGYLRRMDVFSEVQLRIKFLQARDTWFQSILSSIPSNDAYTHITKTVELSRVHLFDIITQYRAIFSDEDPLLNTSKDDTPVEGALFHGWVVHKVSQFLKTLEKDLERGVGGRLDSVLGQCMYFGLSFSRVGADFRGLLAPVFQKYALKSFEAALKEATKKFEDAMMTFTLLSQPALHGGTSGMSYSMSNNASLQPPMALLDFPPLAVYCNNILTAFNDLRLCAPISLADNVANQLQESLSKVVSTILSFHRTEEGAFNQQEQELFTSCCQVFGEEFLPFTNRCLQALFPPTQIAETLGVTVLELAKMGNIGTVDVTVALKPLEHLLPVKKDEVSEVSIGQKPSFTLDTDSADELETSVQIDSTAVNNAVPAVDTASSSAGRVEVVDNKEDIIVNPGVDSLEDVATDIKETPETNTNEQDGDNLHTLSQDGISADMNLETNPADDMKHDNKLHSAANLLSSGPASSETTPAVTSVDASETTSTLPSPPPFNAVYQIPPEIQKLLDQTASTASTGGAS